MKIKRILKYVMMKYGSVTSRQTKTTRVSNVLIRPYDLVSFNYNTGSSTQSISYDNTVDFKVNLNSVTSSNATINLQGPNRHTVDVNLNGELHIHFPDGLYTYSAIDLVGNTASGTFSVPTTLTGTVSIPTSSVSLIQSWYNSLSVKPSAGLWTALNTLVDGLNADGDWSEMDFFSVSAGLETTEQRYRPVKTTSGEDLVNVSNAADNNSGIYPGVNDNSLVSLKWNPVDDGIKCASNSAFFGAYIEFTNINSYTYIGRYSDDFNETMYLIMNPISANVVELNSEYLFGNIGSNTIQKSGINLPQHVFASVKRLNNNLTRSINNQSAISTTNFTGKPTKDLSILNSLDDSGAYRDSESTSNTIFRAVIAGSSLIDHNRVAARLNTFFAARGLSISNY